MGRRARFRYLILILLLVPILSETPGQLKAGFNPKVQCVRDSDPGNHCFSTLSQSCMAACSLHKTDLGMGAQGQIGPLRAGLHT